MLYIMFAIGSDRYALDSSHVVEIVPRVELWQVPKARRTSPGCCAIAGGSCRCLTCAGSCTASPVLPV